MPPPPRYSRGNFLAFLLLYLWSPAAAISAPGPAEGTTAYVKWAVNEPRGTGEFHEPLVVGEAVIVGTDRGELRAYRCKDGVLLWKHAHGKRLFYRPCSDGQRVYFTSDDGLTAVTADAGDKVWAFPITDGGGPTFALGAKGMVVVGGSDGKLYAVDAKTGERRWTTDFVADAPPDRPGFPGIRARGGRGLARPSALSSDGETVFLSVFDQSRVVAVTAADGKQVWSFQANGWIYGPGTVAADRLFVGSQDNHFYCLDKRTGKPLWKFETKNRIESGAAADGASVYFGSCDGRFYAVSQSDGKERWCFNTDPHRDGRPSAIYSTPVLHLGSLYFAAGEGQVYALAARSGAVKWRLRPCEFAELYCSPAADGRCYFVVTRPSSSQEGESSLVAIAVK